jgi:hypothetical protein
MRSLHRIRDFCRRPWFAYLTLLLLQLRVVWGVWEYRDLTPGDTSFYFKDSLLWYQDFMVNITYSPLYTAFYGTLMHLSSDAYLVTTLHRLISICALSTVVLALMRRLLPPDLAWFAAAWWAVSPSNYNALYEVHVFSAIPVIAIWWFALRNVEPLTRGATVAMLLATSVLVRNELIVATGLVTLGCLFWEMWSWREQRGPERLVRYYLTNYGLPILAITVLLAGFYARSTYKFPELLTSNRKHTLNMCQVYAFSYQEQHPEWKGNPWVQCSEVMSMQFGLSEPTLPQMFQRNARAVLDHFWWNLSIAPNGIQVLLFNATSGTVSPDFVDYIPLTVQSSRALVLSIVCSALFVIGLLLFYRERWSWWERWLRPRAFGWLVMASVATVALVVIPVERPRPAYLLSFGIFLIALFGMSIQVITAYVPAIKRLSILMPAVIVALIVAVPNRYAEWSKIRPRNLLEVYRELSPFQEIIARPNTVFLKGDWYMEIGNYLGLGRSRVLPYTLLNEADDVPVDVILKQGGVNLFYVDEALSKKLHTSPHGVRFLTAPSAVGWKLLAFHGFGPAKWMLFQKEPSS